MTHDGLSAYLKDVVPKAPGSTVDIVGILKATHARTWSFPLSARRFGMATKWYVERVLTIVHRVLTDLLRKRDVRLDRTYQLNFGGSTDFLNMRERERLVSKKILKTQAVTSQLGQAIVRMSPSRSGTVGSHCSFSRARVISGRRCVQGHRPEIHRALRYRRSRA